MIKFYFSVLSLLISFALVKAADLPLDFESGAYNITDFDGGVLTIIDNPHSSGINTSARVAKMVKNSGEDWAGSLITLENAIDFSNGKSFKMKVYSPKIGTKVLLKVENASDSNINFEKEAITSVANEWEELTFDYSTINVAQSYRKVVIIFEKGTVGDGSSNFTYFIDDIVLLKGIADEAPSSPAPTPPAYDPLKVISIFSDAFTDVDGTNFNPYWQQTTVGSLEEVQGNQVLKLTALNYQGIELYRAVNAAAMKYLHVDVWTANETALDIYPISLTTGEKKASLVPLNLNAWNSYDIKLSDLTTQNFNLADLHQFKFIGAGGNTVYIDNLYFYDDDAAPDTEAPQEFSVTVGTITYNSIKLLLYATDNSGAVNYSITVGGTTTTVGAVSGLEKSYEFTRLPSATEFTFSITVEDPAGNEATNNPIQKVASTADAFQAPVVSSPTPPERAPEDVISIFSDSYTNIQNTNFNPWWQQSSWFYSEQVGGNEVLKYENFNYQGIEIGSQVNASEMTHLHIDLWTPNETFLSISPISASTGEKAYNLTPIILNEWNSYEVPLTGFTIQGLSMSDILHLKFVGSGKSIIYLDNIYFYKEDGSSAKDLNSQNVLRCYPNPVKDILSISSASEIRSFKLLTLDGKQMLSVSVNELNASFDISALSAGYYIALVTYKNGSQSNHRIIKQ